MATEPHDPWPAADRPYLPGYGIAAADAGAGLLPWSWAVERLAAARRYWVATCRLDGAPHLVAVWGIWQEDRFYFSAGDRSRKARNLAADDRCVITPEYAGEAVVVEGTAAWVTDPRRLADLESAYRTKYGSGLPDPDQNPLFQVRPSVVFGIIEQEPAFQERATRWRFR